MSRGRRGDKTYTGPNGVSSDRLRELRAMRHVGSGIDGRVAPPSQKALRAFIATQTCPWCGDGPYRNLAGHTHRSHGVSAAEFKELAGLGKYAPLCSPEYSTICADRLAGQRLPDSAYGEGQRKPRTLSAAGLASQKANAARLSDEHRRRASSASSDKQLAQNAAKHAEILRRYEAGEAVSAIAEAVNMSLPTVRRTVKRAGVYVDGRTRRWTAPS